jgi:4-hydroxy-2-oxoheptanedioate aldolase
MINSREEAERLVSFVRYPPGGTRSFGPTRVNFAAGSNYGGEADDNILCFAMIETREAFERVEEIAGTPGLDGLYIGPADLTLGLTGKKYRTGFDREEPEMVEAARSAIRPTLRASGPDCTTARRPMRQRRSAGASTS